MVSIHSVFPPAWATVGVGDRQTDATLHVLDAGRQGNALRGSRSMPCKQALLSLEHPRERRRLRAACVHDRCAPLHHRHHLRQHQLQRHNHHHNQNTCLGHDIADGNGENDHRMIVIGERAIDLMCTLSKQTNSSEGQVKALHRSPSAAPSSTCPWRAGRILATTCRTTLAIKAKPCGKTQGETFRDSRTG